MVRHPLSRSIRLWFAALYALTAILVGFAHRMPASATDADPSAAAYVLPGGIVAALCTSGDQGDMPAAGSARCDACRLADAPGLALPEPVIFACLEGAQVVAQALAESLVVAARLYRPASRGPPARLVTA